MPRIFKHLEDGCLQVNLMSNSAQINQLKYTILYYTIFYVDCDNDVFVCRLRTSNNDYNDYVSLYNLHNLNFLFTISRYILKFDK